MHRFLPFGLTPATCRLVWFVLALATSGLGGCVTSRRAAAAPEPDRSAEFDQYAAPAAEANANSVHAVLSADGRLVAFSSGAKNLVPDDLNGVADVFVHDRLSGATERVSVGRDAAETNGDSYTPSISADGRYVAFGSSATNLVAGDTNGQPDVFVFDRVTRQTTLISVALQGASANRHSSEPRISADGTRVAFQSVADNLVPCDANEKQCGRVFVRDWKAGWTRCASVGPRGVRADLGSSQSAISGDGRFVAFVSHATNLVAGDTNGRSDVFVHDLKTGLTERVSDGPADPRGSTTGSAPALSYDGRYVAFAGPPALIDPADPELQAILIRDRQRNTAWRVPAAPTAAGKFAFAQKPAISADGQRVAFEGWTDAPTPADNLCLLRIYVHDVPTRRTWLVSTAAEGAPAGDDSVSSAISANGRHVAFESKAAGIVKEDQNQKVDVFVRDVERTAAARASVPAAEPDETRAP